MLSVLKEQGKLLLLGLPFVVIFLIDALRQHFLPILIVLSLITVFESLNEVLLHQHINKRRYDPFKLWILISFCLFISLLIFFAEPTQSYWFLTRDFFTWSRPDDVDGNVCSSFWSQLFACFLIDFVLRLITICLKSGLLMYGHVQRKKNCLFLLSNKFFAMEALSQMLRFLAPAPQWIKYCFFQSHSLLALRIVCLVGYCVGKVCFFVTKMKICINAYSSSCDQPEAYKLLDEKEDATMLDPDFECPICEEIIQPKLQAVIKCGKSHRLCVYCASVWFARFKKCPLCDADYDRRCIYRCFAAQHQPPPPAACLMSQQDGAECCSGRDDELKRPRNLHSVSHPWGTSTTDSVAQLF